MVSPAIGGSCGYHLRCNRRDCAHAARATQAAETIAGGYGKGARLQPDHAAENRKLRDEGKLVPAAILGVARTTADTLRSGAGNACDARRPAGDTAGAAQ